MNTQRHWRSRRRRIDEATATRIRFLVLRAAVLLSFLILLGQLWRMQIVEGKRYQQWAESNRLRLTSIPAPRGIIYDRNGTMLVQNVPSFSVGVIPADLPKESQKDVSTRLARLLNEPAASLEQAIESSRAQQYLFTPIPLKRNIGHEIAFTIEERQAEFPGIVVIVDATRRYFYGKALSHLLGYMGPLSAAEYANLQAEDYALKDVIGKTGVELSYESDLRGQPGREQVEVNAQGRKIRTLRAEDPTPGDNLVLTVDLDLQLQMSRILLEAVGKGSHGAAVALNPKTGEVLGMVSVPTFDNNLFAGPIDPQQWESLLKDPGFPLLNHAVSSSYPPGSTFKMVTGTAALQEGVATPQTRIVSRGFITIPNQYDPSITYTFPDWAVLGSLDFYQGVAQSSDVYFYYLAGGYEDFVGLGAQRLAGYARDYNLGRVTGIDLPSEAAGLVPNPEWKQEAIEEPWYTGDTYNFGIGQGYLMTTPLQMAVVAATIANGGMVIQPQIVKEITDAQGNVIRPFAPKPLHLSKVSPQNLKILGEGMRQAVKSGTATLAQVPGVDVAGKTGTAEYGAIDPQTGFRPTHGWFTSFAPYNDPEIVVVVFLYNGRGAQDAAPVAGRILNYYFSTHKPAGAKP